MKRNLLCLALIAFAPILSGCVASIAVSALSLAAKSARGRPVDNQALKPQAREKCSAQAAQHGTVHVIDVVQQKVGKIIVWGTVDNGKQRQSFQCDFGTTVTGFRLRPINTLP